MTNHQTILILSGLPASGKTTHAKQWVAEDPTSRVRINYDDLRLSLFGPQWVFNYLDEKKVKSTAIQMAREVLESGYHIVVDNTNLTEKARLPWVELGKEYGTKIEMFDVDTPVSVCVKRDRKREARVGRAVIDRMALFTGWIDWTGLWSYRRRDFVVVDVDGTLADCSWRCHFLDQTPKNYDGFYSDVDKDPPITRVTDLVKTLFGTYNILIVSGRPLDRCGIATEDWLHKHGMDYLHLFMRNGPNDYQPDYVIKQEILDLLPKKRIAFVLDDRDQTVAMWRRNGLTCLQVADGKF